MITKRGRRLQRYDLQLIMCGDIVKDSNSCLKSRGSIEDFVSFREMITSQLQGKLWLYDEVRAQCSHLLSLSMCLIEDEDFCQEAQGHAHVGGVAIQECIAEAIRPLPVVEGKGKAIVTKEQAAQSLLALHTPKRRSTTDQFIFQRRTPSTEGALTRPFAQPQDDTSANIVHDSPSSVDAETGAGSDKKNNGGDIEILQIIDELGEDVDEQVLIDKDQAGPDPGISRVALAGLDPEPTHDEFMTDLYPKVQESLMFLADKHVILEDPICSTGTLSSMKNLEDAYAIGDQFIKDKSIDDELGKLNVEAKVVSMVTVPIYQESFSVPPLLTPIIDLSLSKPASSTTQALIFLATTSNTTTTRLLLPPPQQQSITDYEVFTLELRDLPRKIDEAICEYVKKAIQIALQDPLRDHFRDLPKADMKEMLHQRMFETGSYKSLPEHIALYEALKASMEQAQRDEFFAEWDKSLKRQRNDQDPPPPPLDSDPSKKRRHDFGASGSSQPPAPQLSAWKLTDTRDAPSSSSKQQSVPHSKKLVKDIPMPDTTSISDSEDTSSAHIPHIKPRPEWLKPIPEEDRPATPEPAWVIPTSHIPDAMNNWADALATTYQAQTENLLLDKTRNMEMFMNWYCQKIGKTELTQANFEGQAYEVVKAFYPDVIQL
ncbi:hypothetical protein Tco_0005383 [Tanacetum coccineum]